MFASIFKILEKLIKNWKSYMPLTKVLFSRMSLLFGFFVIEGKTIKKFEYFKEQKKSIYTSSTYIPNFMLIKWFVHELSAFKVEKKNCRKIGFSPFRLKNWLTADYCWVKKELNRILMFLKKKTQKNIENS